MAMKVIALVAGFVVFGILVMLIQYLNGMIFGAPGPEAASDPEALKAFVSSMSAGAFIGLLISYIVGSFAAGFVMRKIAKWDSLVLPLVIGGLGTIFWIMNLAVIPHPVWVAIVGFLCFIPFTVLGHRTAV